jgi:hypothetical protein
MWTYVNLYVTDWYKYLFSLRLVDMAVCTCSMDCNYSILFATISWRMGNLFNFLHEAVSRLGGLKGGDH